MTNLDTPITEFVSSLKSIFSRFIYIVIFVVLSLLLLVVFVYIPIKTIPGNSLKLQLSIFTTRDYVPMAILSILSALFLSMQIFIFRNYLNTKTKLASLAKGGLGGYTGVVGALFATASCASCLFAVLGFLGFGTLIFLINIRWYIVIGAILMLLVSIYFSAKKINGVCESCRINHKKTK